MRLAQLLIDPNIKSYHIFTKIRIKGNSLNKVRVKDRSLFAEDLKRIYRAETEEKAKEEILRLKERWGKIYPKVVKKWEDKAYTLLTFLRYPKGILFIRLISLRY